MLQVLASATPTNPGAHDAVTLNGVPNVFSSATEEYPVVSLGTMQRTGQGLPLAMQAFEQLHDRFGQAHGPCVPLNMSLIFLTSLTSQAERFALKLTAPSNIPCMVVTLDTFHLLRPLHYSNYANALTSCFPLISNIALDNWQLAPLETPIVFCPMHE